MLDTSESGYEAGNCYRNAAKFVLDKVSLNGSDFILCHGQVKSPQTGEYHGHAWVEWGDGTGIVIDPTNDRPEANIFVLPFFYESGEIDGSSVKYYERFEILRLSVEYGDWGPWPEDEQEA